MAAKIIGRRGPDRQGSVPLGCFDMGVEKVPPHQCPWRRSAQNQVERHRPRPAPPSAAPLAQRKAVSRRREGPAANVAAPIPRRRALRSSDLHVNHAPAVLRIERLKDKRNHDEAGSLGHSLWHDATWNTEVEQNILGRHVMAGKLMQNVL